MNTISSTSTNNNNSNTNNNNTNSTNNNNNSTNQNGSATNSTTNHQVASPTRGGGTGDTQSPVAVAAAGAASCTSATVAAGVATAGGNMPVGGVQSQNPTQGLVHWMSAVMAEHMTSNSHHDPTVGMHYMWNGGVDVSNSRKLLHTKSNIFALFSIFV